MTCPGLASPSAEPGWMRLGTGGQHCQQDSGAPNLSSFQNESVQAARAGCLAWSPLLQGPQHSLVFQSWTWARGIKGVGALDLCIKPLPVHPPLTSGPSSDNQLSCSLLRASSSHPEDLSLSTRIIVKTQSGKPLPLGAASYPTLLLLPRDSRSSLGTRGSHC